MPRNSGVNPKVFCPQMNTANSQSWTVSWSHSVASSQPETTSTKQVPIDASKPALPAVGEKALDLETARVNEIMADIKCRTLIVRVMLWSLIAIPILFLIHPVLGLLGGTVVARLMHDLIKYYFAKQQMLPPVNSTEKQTQAHQH